ncbi:MAG: CoA ester lyase [Immundisolibacteraceae bacterium]|nr:CoA ester lyase [Immundisolibacteraceae bacterium]
MTNKASDLPEFSLPLFVPGSRPERIPKAWAAGSDAIIIDLEDAVDGADKNLARKQVKQALSELDRPRVTTYLRINGADTPWYQGDIKLVNELNIDGVMLPKAESLEALQSLRQAIDPTHNILALIETAIGVSQVRAIAPGCDRLVFGSIDYCSDLGLAHTQTALLHARAEIVLASRVAGLVPPLDGVTSSTNDATLIEADASHSAELGFGGKLLIHPAQITPARQGFAPSTADINWAEKILAANQSGSAIAVDGAMVDAPVIAQAKAIINKQELLS